MVGSVGEALDTGLRGSFDRRVKLEFHGSNVTSDAGLLAYRDLDDALGLTAWAGNVLADSRTGKNGWHGVVGLLRQSVYGRLAGYEDVNDAGRLGRDPAMRWIVGGKAVERGGRALVADQPRREAREDRRHDRHACPVRHVPDGRGRGTEAPVRGNPAADRAAPAVAISGVTQVVSAGRKTTGKVRLDDGKRSDQQPETAAGDACSGKRGQSPLLNALQLAAWTQNGYLDARNWRSSG